MQFFADPERPLFCWEQKNSFKVHTKLLWRIKVWHVHFISFPIFLRCSGCCSSGEKCLRTQVHTSCLWLQIPKLVVKISKKKKNLCTECASAACYVQKWSGHITHGYFYGQWNAASRFPFRCWATCKIPSMWILWR